MTRYSWLVLTNAVPGREAEFDRWYNEVHVPDLLRVPGVIGVTRGRLAASQTASGTSGISVVPTEQTELAHRYLAMYIIETDDLDKVLRTVAERAGTDEMVMSDALGQEIATMCFEDIFSVPVPS